MAVAAHAALRAAPSFHESPVRAATCSPHRHDRLTQMARGRSRFSRSSDRAFDRARVQRRLMLWAWAYLSLGFLLLPNNVQHSLDPISTGKPPSRGGALALACDVELTCGAARARAAARACGSSRARQSRRRERAVGRVPSSTSSATGRTRRSSTRRLAPRCSPCGMRAEKGSSAEGPHEAHLSRRESRICRRDALLPHRVRQEGITPQPQNAFTRVFRTRIGSARLSFTSRHWMEDTPGV